MLMCDKHESWQRGEKEELQSIEKHCVWTREQPPYGTKVIPLKWVYIVNKGLLGAIQRYKDLVDALWNHSHQEDRRGGEHARVAMTDC